ncbi:MAG: hypothetical protein AB7U48_14065, partial [Bauldia sp.]
RGAGPAPRLGMDGQPITYQSRLVAMSPTESNSPWSVEYPYLNMVPVFATATDLLFLTDNATGTFTARNATNGELVWDFRTGSSIFQSPISYIGPDGRQYIAVISSQRETNTAVAIDMAPDAAARYRRTGSTLYVFALPETVAGAM